MLKKLRIQNFKVWEDTGEIDLAPITLFFGANSSGKSSIGQFLIMLKQTVESRGRDVFHLGDRYSAVQLGSYREMVFQRDTKKILDLSTNGHSESHLQSSIPILLMRDFPVRISPFKQKLVLEI